MRRDFVILLLERVREITGVERPVIVGSQVVHALTSDVPPVIERSREVDIMFDGLAPAALRAVGREVGALSPMADEFGVYADPVRRSVIALPAGWEGRLVDLTDRNGEVVAACLDPVDASVAKLVAGRSKDIEFVTALLELGLVDCATLAVRTESLDRRLGSLARAIDDLIARLGETVDDRSLTLLRDAAIQLNNRASAEETP